MAVTLPHIRCWIGCAAIITLLTACRRNEEQGLPDMKVTLASGDTRPMGGKVFRTFTEGQFEDYTLENNARPFHEWYRNYANHYATDANDVYMLVAPVLNVRENEAREMLRFVKSGNTLFVAADRVSIAFKDAFEILPESSDSLQPTNLFGLTDTYLQAAQDTFSYYFQPLNQKLDTLPGYLQQVIGRNLWGEPDALQIKIGKGELILVTNAEALSNYFLLTRKNYRYALHLLSYVNDTPENVYWDEFYHRNPFRQAEDGSVFDAILSVPALRWAFWLFLLLCALAVLTHMARRQRIIPVRVPNRNTTVEFTQTIARLYYNQKDNRNIAIKMIQHFLEHIRNQHYIPHQKLNQDFARLLAGKTGMPVEKTERLVARMASIQEGGAVSDETLLWLNREMTDVYKPAKI